MKSVIFKYFNEIEKETTLKIFINEEMKREKLLYHKFYKGKYIVSNDIKNLYKILDQIRKEIDSLKNNINKNISKEVYRKLAKKWI